MITDPIADMLTRIRNANAKMLEKVDIPSSKMKIELARVLKEEGLIANYKSIEDHKQGLLRIYMKYSPEGEKALKGIRRASRPGLRVYRGYMDLPKSGGGIGVAVISTPKGLMADRKAKQEKLGGEVLCYAW
jgi:small subunit ribosomal protein S8